MRGALLLLPLALGCARSGRIAQDAGPDLATIDQPDLALPDLAPPPDLAHDLTWTNVPSCVNTLLLGVWGAGDDVFAVGPSAVCHRQGLAAQFASESVLDKPYLSGVWGSGPTDVYAAGGSTDFSAGVIDHSNGAANWTPEVMVMANATAVWGSGPTDVWVVGVAGAIVHSDGSGAWGPIGSGTGALLNAISGSGPAEAYLVGYGGVILRWDGVAWTALSSGTTQPLHGVAAPLAGELYAVGDAGTILHSVDGGKTFTAQTDQGQLNAVWQDPIGGDVFVVGEGGRVLRSGDHGASWQPQSTGNKNTLWAVWGDGAGKIWAVGDNGTIVLGR